MLCPSSGWKGKAFPEHLQPQVRTHWAPPKLTVRNHRTPDRTPDRTQQDAQAEKRA